MIARQGRLYSFLSDSNEVTVLDLTTGAVELLDLKKMIATELSGKQLGERFEILRKALTIATEKREKLGGRGNEIAAKMSRDLIEPHLQNDLATGFGRLAMTNPSVELELVGEPEPDADRLEAVANILTILLRLAAIRDPEALPPFANLEAVSTLTRDHKHRPAEMSILYRLAGPPRKYRWTYRLEPSLAPREIESLSRINALLARAKVIRFERYERERDAE